MRILPIRVFHASSGRKSGGVVVRLAVMMLLAAQLAIVPSNAANKAPARQDEGAYEWRPVAIGAGGYITGYAADRTGATRVIRADVHGAYIWLREADRWAQLVTSANMPESERVQDGGNEGVYEIVVAPSDPKRIYMALKGHVFRSDDRGERFVRTSNPPGGPPAFDANSAFRHYGPFMAVDPSNPDTVFFGTPENGLLRSRDAGATWQRVTSVPKGANLRDGEGQRSPGILLWFEPARSGGGGRIWAMSAGNGVFVSGDGGETFSPLVPPEAPQPRLLRQGAFAPDGTFFGVDYESRSVWRFKDNAWANLVGRPGLAARPYASVAVNPQTSQVVVMDESGKTFRSTDADGLVWVRLPHSSMAGTKDPPWLRLSNQSYFATGPIVFDPAVPNRLWIGAGMGVFRAELDRDTTKVAWVSESRGIEELVANDVIHRRGNPPLFAAWDFGIHRKEDLDAFSTTFAPRERMLMAAQQLDWTPADPAFIVTNASDTRTFCCSEDGDAVMAGYSMDGGRTWTKFATLPQPPGTEAGDPWRMSFGSIAVASDSIDNIVWLPTFNRAPFYTKDRGRTWTRVMFPGEVGPFTGSHERYYFARKTVTADRVEPGTFYLVHSGGGANEALKGLWRTRDGGAHWDKIFAGEIAPGSAFSAKLRAVPGVAGHLFFTSGVSGIPDMRLRRSTDGGVSWHALDGVERVDDIGFGKAEPGASYPTIFVSGRVGGAYGIWRSTDDASSWKRVGHFPVGTLDQVSVVEGDKDVFGRVYLGYKGSGWIYGSPSSCAPAPYRFSQASECIAVE